MGLHYVFAINFGVDAHRIARPHPVERRDSAIN